MNTQISIPVSTSLFLELAEFLEAKKDGRDPVQVVSDAIDYWMANADSKPELLHQSATHGFQWKSLFLPSGTEIRMQYKGQYHYAAVDGDQVMFDGKPTTPGSLANKITGTSRNAWRDLWIKRPGDTTWSLADDCRAEGQPSE
ncbi:hypothetical protein [Castellaniella caeni]|uniref:hypothetical protein n=1 Tax=Castellaniella caeni TaxID=266123 RepID=UPI000837639D|nr:hypothetical protein [Castellaniella caeni]